MKLNYKGLIFVFVTILIIPIIMAWTPVSDIDGRNYYNIFNFTNISAGEIYQNGSLLLSNESILNVNSSVYWDGETSQADLNVNSSTFWGFLDDISDWFVRVGTSLGFNTTKFNETYDKKYTDTYNATYESYRNNVSLNYSLNSYSMWDDRWTDTYNSTYAGYSSTYNSTYEGYRSNVSINYSLNSYSMWDDRWTDTYNSTYAGYSSTYNSTYEGYRSNVSLNYSLNSYSMWDSRWTDTFNSTYEGYRSNVSLNYSLNSYSMWDDRWTDTYNESYDNKSEYAFGYNNFEGSGNFTGNWFFGNISWSWIQDKFISAVGKYFFMDGTTLNLNTTELNETIDERLGIAGNYTAGLGIKLTGTNFSVEAGSGLTQEISGLKVEDNGINDTHLEYNTGQNLTTASGPTFDNVTISTQLNPAINLTFGKGWIIPQGEFGCFDASCDHYIYENSSGVLIIV